MAHHIRFRNRLTDHDGIEYEFSYDEKHNYERDDEGSLHPSTTEVWNFRFRKEDGDPAPADHPSWQSLPSWADIHEDWKINLGFFDEDDETEELTYWPVSSKPRPVEVS